MTYSPRVTRAESFPDRVFACRALAVVMVLPRYWLTCWLVKYHSQDNPDNPQSRPYRGADAFISLFARVTGGGPPSRASLSGPRKLRRASGPGRPMHLPGPDGGSAAVPPAFREQQQFYRSFARRLSHSAARSKLTRRRTSAL